MVVVFRCFAIHADGACMDSRGVQLFDALTEHLPLSIGWLIQLAWLASEVFVVIGILNVIASVFVVEAIDANSQIQQEINELKHAERQLGLQNLDRLLRNLVHPGRELTNPKDAAGESCAALIQDKYPEIAARIPHLEVKAASYAKYIQESKAIHAKAMTEYESNELIECKQLRSMPDAKTYLVDGKEVLLADSGCVRNSLGLGIARAGAISSVTPRKYKFRGAHAGSKRGSTIR